jgi:hypothetical protein
MNLFKTLGSIVLSVLGTKEFSTDGDGRLVLSAEDAEKLNAQMKFAGGNFSEMFKQSFDAQAEANAGNNVAQNELIVNALVDAIRKDITAELNVNKEAITAELQQEFTAKIANLVSEKDLATRKATEMEAEKNRLARENEILSTKTEPDQPEGKAGLRKIEGGTMGDFKANRKHFHNKMAFDFIEGNSSAAILAMTNQSFGNKTMGGGPSDTIDVSEINEEFGSYLADQATRMTIYKEMLKPTESRTYMTKVLALTEWRDAMSQISSVVQQFVAKWTPLGKVKMTPLKIVNRRHKVNLPIVPDDITGGYLTYLYNEGLTPDQMPVTKYIIDQLLRPKIADDIEYKMIATGVFDELVASEVTEGDPGQAPEKSMDGFLTILTNESENVSTAVNFWTPTVVWSEDNSVAYFEAYADWIKSTNPTLAKVGMNVFCDPNMAEIRAKKYREMFPLTKNTDMGNMKIDFSNLTIVPLENMRGSGMIFATPKVNFIELHHINEASGATKLFLQLMNYEVRIFGEFWLATGFAVAEWVFAVISTEASGS